MALHDESFEPRFTAIDCIGAMWLAGTVHDVLPTRGIPYLMRYAVDHEGTPAVQVRRPDRGRAGLIPAEAEGVMAIVSHDEDGEYLCVHETPEHREPAPAVG